MAYGLSATRRSSGACSAFTSLSFPCSDQIVILAVHACEYKFGSSSPTRAPCVILGYLRPCHSHQTSPPTTRRAPSYTISLGKYAYLQGSGSTPQVGISVRNLSVVSLGSYIGFRVGPVADAVVHRAFADPRRAPVRSLEAAFTLWPCRSPPCAGPGTRSEELTMAWPHYPKCGQ